MLHKIKTIVFEGTVTSDEDAQLWTAQVRGLNLEQTIGEVLDEFDVDDWIKIPRLEIDLGSIDLHSSEWVIRLIEDLRGQLKKQLHLGSGITSFVHYDGDFFIDGLTQKHIAKEDYELEILLSYLRTGVLPWQVEEELNLEKIIEDWVAHRPVKFATLLAPYLKKRMARARFLDILGEEHLLKLVAEFFSEKESSLAKQLIETVNQVEGGIAAAKLFYLLHEYFLMSISRNVQIVSPQQSFSSTLERMIRIAKKAGSENTLNAYEELETILIYVLQHSDASITLSSKTISPIPRDHSELQHGPLLIGETVETYVDETEYEDDDQVQIKQEGIFIENAGLVLINAGFIKKYFEQLGWIKEQMFISEASRFRAISWLHWLCCSEDRPAGYRLAFNKLLCGLDPTEVVSITFELTDNERESGNELLSNIIDQWAALKKISTQSLQQSFLQRSGRLVETDELWQLHVESKAYDILVEQLPWTFTIIKLPWMAKPLFTQWSTRI